MQQFCVFRGLRWLPCRFLMSDPLENISTMATKKVAATGGAGRCCCAGARHPSRVAALGIWHRRAADAAGRVGAVPAENGQLKPPPRLPRQLRQRLRIARLAALHDLNHAGLVQIRLPQLPRLAVGEIWPGGCAVICQRRQGCARRRPAQRLRNQRRAAAGRARIHDSPRAGRERAGQRDGQHQGCGHPRPARPR